MHLIKDKRPLIDGDWLCYMACSAVEYPLMQQWKEECVLAEQAGRSPPPEPTPSFESTYDVVVNKLKEIDKALNTTLSPIIFFTGANNFRKEMAKTKVYKGNRKSDKPFLYNLLVEHMHLNYDCQTEDRLEADDLMAIYQTHNNDTCIVTVDKDLRQVNGWHYSPEGSNYPSFGPAYVTDKNSYIEYKDKDKPAKGLVGTGYKFFYAQVVIGDTVDNIPGLPRHGPKAALDILEGKEGERECYEAVRDAYRDMCIMADDYLLEQINLLWMVRETIGGEPVLWEEPNG